MNSDPIENLFVGLCTFLFFRFGALLFLLWSVYAGRALRAIRRTKTTKAAFLATRRAGELVELQGVVRCATPLTSLYTSTPCVYYRAEIVKEGRKGGESKEFAEERSVPFELEDETGRVRVDPAGADIEAKTLLQEELPLNSLAAELIYDKKASARRPSRSTHQSTSSGCYGTTAPSVLRHRAIRARFSSWRAPSGRRVQPGAPTWVAQFSWGFLPSSLSQRVCS